MNTLFTEYRERSQVSQVCCYECAVLSDIKILPHLVACPSGGSSGSSLGIEPWLLALILIIVLLVLGVVILLIIKLIFYLLVSPCVGVSLPHPFVSSILFVWACPCPTPLSVELSLCGHVPAHPFVC